MHFGPEDVEMLETVQVGDALTGLKARQVDVASGTFELTIEPRSASQLCALAAHAGLRHSTESCCCFAP